MTAENEDLLKHVYSIENFDILSLNEVFIQIHSSQTFTPGKEVQGIFPEDISVNHALFIGQSASENSYSVSVGLMDRVLKLTCSCNSPTKKMCAHEALVMYSILKRTDLKIFFDEHLRLEKLKKYSEQFGLEKEKDLNQYFYLSFENGKAEIRSKIKGLVAFNMETTEKLTDFFTTRPTFKRALELKEKEEMFVVFKQHKYYKHLLINLSIAVLGNNGRIKSPVKPLRAFNYIWQNDDVLQTKFFTAIQLFENGPQEVTQATIDALRAILKNPLGLKFFEHDFNVSDNLSARSLKELGLIAPVSECRLTVLKEDLFYTITARVVLDGVVQPVQNLKVKHNYFIENEGKLYLPINYRILQLISLFRQYDFSLTVAENKYAEFRGTFLAKLEDEIEVNYSYLEPATETQLQENNFDRPPEMLIYLTDSNPYIEIEPVMKYGKEEVAVLSRRQIYSTGIKGEAFSIRRDIEAETKFVANISKQHPFFDEQLQEGLPYFYLHKERFLDENWFLDAFETWTAQEIQIFGFNKLSNNALNPHKAKIRVQVLSGTNWFNVELEVRYGAKRASLKKIRRAVKNKSRYVELDDGSLGIIPEEWLQKFRNYFEAGEIIHNELQVPRTNFELISRLFENDVLSKDVKSEVESLRAAFADFETLKEVDEPEGLQGSLRDYQKQGLNWLNFLDDLNFGACLADDMGLGKTLQVLALLLLQREKREKSVSLVVVPTSLLFNWQAEIAKFAPSLKTYCLYGTNRKYRIEEFAEHEVILTSYGTLLSDINYIKDFEFNYVILDESQNIKNPESQRYKAVRLLKCRNRIVLTGTPFENNTFDLYAQLSFACPGLLGSKRYFRDVYSTPIDKFKNSNRLLELQNLIKPFILRRTKKQVATELPEKTEMVLYCEMKEEQRKVYENYEQEVRDYLSGINNDDISRSSIHVLRGLTRLRQICDSPLLLREPTLTAIGSAKIEALLEQIETKSKKHKILVFSQFVTMLDLVKKELEKTNVAFSLLTGSTRDREKEVSRFQDNDNVRVFLISLKAGGTGLNLTKADYVYLMDPWWNPATENQAIDRIYRIGQKKNVVAVRMICPNTVEEKILKLQKGKTELAERLINTETSFFNSLTKDDLMNLVSSTIPNTLR